MLEDDVDRTVRKSGGHVMFGTRKKMCTRLVVSIGKKMRFIIIIFLGVNVFVTFCQTNDPPGFFGGLIY